MNARSQWGGSSDTGGGLGGGGGGGVVWGVGGGGGGWGGEPERLRFKETASPLTTLESQKKKKTACYHESDCSGKKDPKKGSTRKLPRKN